MASSTFSASDVIALGSLFTAVCAFVATAWQASIAREHNRKGTTPMLTFHGDHRSGCIVTIRNDGVGPAILKELKYFVDGQPCESVEEFDRRLGPPERVVVSRSKFTPPGAVGVGHSILVVQVEVPNDLRELGDRTIRRVGIQVTYESVYGERYVSEVWSH